MVVANELFKKERDSVVQSSFFCCKNPVLGLSGLILPVFSYSISPVKLEFLQTGRFLLGDSTRYVIYNVDSLVFPSALN